MKLNEIDKKADTQRYRIAPNSNDVFGWWINNSKFADTLSQAKKIRTEIARGIGLPTSAIWIWNMVTGNRIV